MEKKMLLAGFLTLSMVAACHGAENKKAYKVLAKQRTAINASTASPISKREQQRKLQKTIQHELECGDRVSVSVKERRILHALQHRVRQDTNPKTGRTLIFD